MLSFHTHMSVPAINAEELSWQKLLYTYSPPFRIPFGGYKGSGFLGRRLQVVFWNFWPRFEPQELQKTIFSLFYTVIGSSLQGYEFYSCVGVSYNERSVQNVRRTCAEHAI